MRALVLKPHRLSSAGNVGEALLERGVGPVDHVLSEDGRPPNVDAFDLMLVMGAPWSVYGEDVAPWIEGALGAIRDAVVQHVPVLGICFGAQVFAQAMGGRARPAEDLEVGWRTVQTSDPSLVPEGPWFMWHGDTFDLPGGATTVAWTDVGVQAYTMGPHVCVQFHPEATPEILAAWLDHDDEDIRRAGLDPSDLLAETRRREPEARARAAALVDRFLQGAQD
jgi:GMP synthase-like glutamine amidotransferase